MESPQTPEHASFTGRGLQASPTSSSPNSESSASSSTGGCPIPPETSSSSTDISIDQAQDDEELDLEGIRKRLKTLHDGYEAKIETLEAQSRALQTALITLVFRKLRQTEKTFELADKYHKLEQSCEKFLKRYSDRLGEMSGLRERLRERSTQYNRLRMEHDGLVSKAEGLEATCEEQAVEIERLRVEREGFRGEVILLRWVLVVCCVLNMVLAIWRHWWRIELA